MAGFVRLPSAQAVQLFRNLGKPPSRDDLDQLQFEVYFFSMPHVRLRAAGWPKSKTSNRTTTGRILYHPVLVVDWASLNCVSANNNSNSVGQTRDAVVARAAAEYCRVLRVARVADGLLKRVLLLLVRGFPRADML